jgi:hypothetical protein
MISLLNPLPSGNAVRILLNPPSTAVSWQLVRNETGVFVDQDDGVVYTGNEKAIVDIAAMANGTKVYYQPWYFDGTAWDGTSAVKSVTPSASFVDRSVDPFSIVRDRLDAGLNALVARGDLTHPRGIIPVLTSYPQVADPNFPLVTVHLDSDSAEVRALGECPMPDELLPDGWDMYEGYLSSVHLEILGWTLNGDARKTLRKAIKAVLIANLEVFDAQGLYHIDLRFSDMEDFQTYQSPIYYTQATIRCLAPSAVSSNRADTVSGLSITLT